MSDKVIVKVNNAKVNNNNLKKIIAEELGINPEDVSVSDKQETKNSDIPSYRPAGIFC